MVEQVSNGTAAGVANTGEYLFQTGIDVAPNVETFNIKWTAINPFPGLIGIHDGQQIGGFIGTGDQDNFLVGDPVQVLLPGVSYSLDWYAGIQDGHNDAGDDGASATGDVRVDFLPEPSSALLLGAGAAALTALSRSRPNGRTSSAHRGAARSGW